jgi:hypothetical protein
MSHFQPNLAQFTKGCKQKNEKMKTIFDLIFRKILLFEGFLGRGFDADPGQAGHPRLPGMPRPGARHDPRLSPEGGRSKFGAGEDEGLTGNRKDLTPSRIAFTLKRDHSSQGIPGEK